VEKKQRSQRPGIPARQKSSFHPISAVSMKKAASEETAFQETRRGGVQVQVKPDQNVWRIPAP
jgi:hypothetical protein